MAGVAVEVGPQRAVQVLGMDPQLLLLGVEVVTALAALVGAVTLVAIGSFTDLHQAVVVGLN